MNVRRDLWLVLTIVFTFLTLVLFVMGVILTMLEFRAQVNALRAGFAYWWLGVVDALLLLAALMSYRQYKRYLNRW